MPRHHTLLVLLVTISPILSAQVKALPASIAPVLTVASDRSEGSSSAAALPDAPGAGFLTDGDPEDQAGIAASAGKPGTSVAPRYAGIILPGQTAAPLTGLQKVAYSFHDAFNLYQLAGVTISAGYSQVVDSAPHYDPGAEGFGKREGVAALRNTIQILSTDAIFAPIFHDDPRYYELGQGHRFFARAWYAATRVVVTRSDAGHGRFNAPLLLGYGVAAGANNAYYPDQDTGASASLKSFGTSLGGAALGFEANEFFDDALRMLHIRK